MGKFKLRAEHEELVSELMQATRRATGASQLVVVFANSDSDLLNELKEQVTIVSRRIGAPADANYQRDWTPPKDSVPTSRGFHIGDRVIHPFYGGGLVTGNVNGHTEVRFYEQDHAKVFIGVTADDLKLATLEESAAAYPIKRVTDGDRSVEYATGELATFESEGTRNLKLALDAGYTVSMSFYPPDPTKKTRDEDPREV